MPFPDKDEAKKERTDTLLLFVPLYVKADNFIKNMVVHQESLDDAKSVLSMVKETIKANSMAIQVSKFGDSKNKISGLNDRMIFIAEFYEFWIDTHEAIKSPETKYVSIDEL